ncbi:MAG: hypothetical protein KF722_00695 [Nitrospira sp.]|nr:hypothetical protein [Nitrospira sp.]
MRFIVRSTLGVMFAAGLLSGCGGGDNVPNVTSNGPAAAVEEQRTPQSDALTSEEATLVSQGNSEPDPATSPDL